MNSLVSLNLLKYISSNESNIFTRKMISNINLQQAKELSDEFDFKIEEYIITDWV